MQCHCNVLPIAMFYQYCVGSVKKELKSRFFPLLWNDAWTERDEQQVLFISLNKPASDLLAFCPSEDRHAHIIFDAKEDVFSAALAVFGPEKIQTSKVRFYMGYCSIIKKQTESPTYHT